MPAPLQISVEGYYLDLDHTATLEGWRVYHDPCGQNLIVETSGWPLDDIVPLIEAHVCPTVSPVEAMNYAMFVLANFMDPTASSEGDVAELENKAPLITEALDRIRGFLIASGEDLPGHVFSDDTGTADAPITDVLTAPGMDPAKVAALGERQIQVTHLITVTADATDDDVATLVSNMTVQAEDPRDDQGEDVAFSTSHVEADWFFITRRPVVR